ncbi:MAG TPA: hypothetical protein VHH73_04155 [Verrucomicrobiae bacterium]|nr:hypothetical protein [Verrucomicrobiae bacterium]
MKITHRLRSLFLLLALVGFPLVAPETRADRDGFKPYKGESAEFRKDILPAGSWTGIEFLQLARWAAGRQEDFDIYGESTGSDNIGGRFTAKGWQIDYVTSADELGPVEIDWYYCVENTYAGGAKIRFVAWGHSNRITGAITGQWIAVYGTDRFRGTTGGGMLAYQFTDPVRLTTEGEIIGRILTVGAGR